MTRLALVAAGLLILADVHPVPAVAIPTVVAVVVGVLRMRTTTVHVVGQMRRWG